MARVLWWVFIAAVAVAVLVGLFVRWATKPRATLDGSAWLNAQIEKHQRERREERHELYTRGLP